ncbi:uracil permease [Erysipelotrichaceae bacterium RD49]|nr:uracil permease [Erysipelotrichaceae bacterium RD49]
MAKKIIQVEEKVPASLMFPLSVQHLFAMFGATVLVPFILGINPAIVLFMNGVGTLLFIAITKGKAPAYLGSSFAFLGPASLVIAKWGYPYALGGFVAVGFLGCILAFIIKKFGTNWIDIVLPPAAMGPVVALIGLELAGSAASTAGIVGDEILMSNVIIFLATLATAVIGNLCFRKFFSIVSILIAVIVGYLTAACLGVVDFAPIAQAPLFQLPNFQFPKFSWGAVMTMVPVILVITSEHVGHQIVTSQIVGRDLIKDPGLDKTIFADNFSTMISGLVGSVPTTTYGENIGVMALTGVYSVWVIGGAAVLSICCAFIGPLCALIQSIPSAVIGGISFLLYGMIGVSGLRILIDEKVDYGNNVNMILTSVVFVTGLSGVTVQIGDISLSGMVLAALTGIVMSLMIYIFDKTHLLNENSREPENEMTELAEQIAAEHKAQQ